MVCPYINEVAVELVKKGRRSNMCGYMLIAPDTESKITINMYGTSAPDKAKQDYILANVSKNIVIADWQYWAKEAPVETAFIFKNAGFDVMPAPWDCSVAESQSCIDTAMEDGIFGIMHTTWHTLTRGVSFITRTGIACFEKEISLNRDMAPFMAKTAEKMRKVYFVDGDYEKAGWSKKQIGFFFA